VTLRSESNCSEFFLAGFARQRRVGWFHFLATERTVCMTQQQLDREVANKMGESVGTIRRHGFSLITPLTIFDPDAEEMAQPQILDWDQVEADRYAPAA
jgi:hypothetical protein